MPHKRLLVLAYLLLMAGGMALGRAYGLDAATALAAMRAGLHGGPVNAVAASGYVLTLALCVFLSLPANPPLYLLGGYLFGAVEATLLATLGNALGATGAYRFFSAALPAGVRIPFLESDRAFATLVLLRLSPWFPAPLINLVCGMAKVPRRRFFLSTLLGSMPLIFAYALAASRLRGPLDMSALNSPELLLATGLLGVLSLVALREPLRLAQRLRRDLAATRTLAARSGELESADAERASRWAG